MICAKCASNNINIQITTEQHIKNIHHGVFWWIFIGSWWMMIKWFIFTVPALIVKIFAPRRKKIVTRQRSMGVCQTCGHIWEIKN